MMIWGQADQAHLLLAHQEKKAKEINRFKGITQQLMCLLWVNAQSFFPYVYPMLMDTNFKATTSVPILGQIRKDVKFRNEHSS